MTSLLHCIFRNCFDREEDDDIDDYDNTTTQMNTTATVTATASNNQHREDRTAMRGACRNNHESSLSLPRPTTTNTGTTPVQTYRDHDVEDEALSFLHPVVIADSVGTTDCGHGIIDSNNRNSRNSSSSNRGGSATAGLGVLLKRLSLFQSPHQLQEEEKDINCRSCYNNDNMVLPSGVNNSRGGRECTPQTSTEESKYNYLTGNGCINLERQRQTLVVSPLHNDRSSTELSQSHHSSQEEGILGNNACAAVPETSLLFAPCVPPTSSTSSAPPPPPPLLRDLFGLVRRAVVRPSGTAAAAVTSPSRRNGNNFYFSSRDSASISQVGQVNAEEKNKFATTTTAAVAEEEDEVDNIRGRIDHWFFKDSLASWQQQQQQYNNTNNHATTIREASKFDFIPDISYCPSIQSNEIVLPGSEIQRRMAEQMILSFNSKNSNNNSKRRHCTTTDNNKSRGDTAALVNDSNPCSTSSKHWNNDDIDDDECVICMDTFTPDNPRMPTLCGCGENKTFFHLPCLYQWIDQNVNCPSCRKKLVWEEF